MRRWVTLLVPLAMWIGLVAAHPGAQTQGRGTTKSDGWTIPAGAENEKNPLPVNDAILAGGRKVFVSKCQRCHGREGKGDGPDADKKQKDHMNLTLASRAVENPDGVVFNRVWNGRSSPKMPKFSEELSREQVWAVVAYVQTLRGKQSPQP